MRGVLHMESLKRSVFFALNFFLNSTILAEDI